MLSLRDTTESQWYIDWCQPIVVALYERNEAKIDYSINLAQHALIEGTLRPEHTACLDYQLAYLEVQAQMVLKRAGWVRERLQEITYLLKTPCQFPDADNLRSRLYLQLRVILDQVGRMQLSEPEFSSLYIQVPPDQHNTEFWHYLSGWAFRHDNIMYLEAAYEFAVQQPGGFNVAWNWQRVEMMIKLVRDVATHNDLEWILGKVQRIEQLNSLRKDIWPRAQSIGLVTEKLQLQIDAKMMDLHEHNQESLERLIRPYCSNQHNGPSMRGGN